jgi:CDP-diacylglycerol--glycerol-3-phosphate 3-phosphatidyltransferase
MVSYAKARAEGLGLECKTGLLARPERVVILAIGLITGTVIWAVLLLAIFSNVTAVERVMHIWRVTRHFEAVSQPDKSPADGHSSTEVGVQFVAPTNRPEPINTNEGVEPSIQPVHTSVPPFNRSVQQE